MLSNHFLLLFLLLHLHLKLSLLIPIRPDIGHSFPLFIPKRKINTNFLTIFFQQLVNSLHILKSSLMKSSISIIILMINKKLSIKLRQQRIFLNFIQNSHNIITFISSHSYHKTTISIIIKFSTIIYGQLLNKKIKSITISFLNN